MRDGQTGSGRILSLNLVTEQTRIVNQMNAIFARFRIRAFRPTLRKAEEKLKGLRTAQGARGGVRSRLYVAAQL